MQKFDLKDICFFDCETTRGSGKGFEMGCGF